MACRRHQVRSLTWHSSSGRTHTHGRASARAPGATRCRRLAAQLRCAVPPRAAEMKVTHEEMKAARVPLLFRDYCAHILIPLNDCRVKTWYAMWKCQELRHAYEKCQYDECAARHNPPGAHGGVLHLLMWEHTCLAGTSGEWRSLPTKERRPQKAAISQPGGRQVPGWEPPRRPSHIICQRPNVYTLCRRSLRGYCAVPLARLRFPFLSVSIAAMHYD